MNNPIPLYDYKTGRPGYQIQQTFPPGETQDSFFAKLIGQWEEIAFFGYQSFLEQGKGAVVWRWDKEELVYMPADSLQRAGADTMLRMAEHYDSKSVIALGVWWMEDNSPMMISLEFFVINRPSPWQCYQLRRNLNRN